MAARSFTAALRFGPGRHAKACFPNNGRGFRQLDRWLKSHNAGLLRAGVESTNVYGQAVATWLHAHGHEVYLLNPERTAHYARAVGQVNKTDPADAALIAEYVALHRLTRWTPPSPEQHALCGLTRTRHQLVTQALQLRNQLRTAHTAAKPFLQAALRALLAQVRSLERALAEHLRQHPNLGEQVRRLRTIKGVGPVTAAVAVAELPPVRPDSDPRALCAWAGLVPRRWQSGQLQLPGRLLRKGNVHLRQALFLPAIVAARHNPLFKAFATTLRAKGKRPGAIAGALSHKLLRIMIGLLKTQTDFHPLGLPSSP